ncbi:cytidylyltransferase domain-containing protein [Longimicrobium sp.]|uniref:cytidylyltransferase domain-containing protein n=1 Tax=Longimicrobium sp. TaxID=2029185 RepID=UPI003B3B6127
MKVVGIIQARMGSTRLPGKVLRPLAGEPMLARCVSRLQHARTLDQVVVATTTGEEDDAIVDLCRARGWPWFRGECDDVLDRYYRAARQYGAGVVVRVTSDCPLLGPRVVDRVVSALGDADLASNVLPRHTWPRGLDAEAVRMDALERAWHEDTNPATREHVTLYIKRHPERFRLVEVNNHHALPEMRWTVDTPEDYAFASRVYDHFGHDRFSWREVLLLLRSHPEIAEMNRHVMQKALPA